VESVRARNDLLASSTVLWIIAFTYAVPKFISILISNCLGQIEPLASSLPQIPKLALQ